MQYNKHKQIQSPKKKQVSLKKTVSTNESHTHHSHLNYVQVIHGNHFKNIHALSNVNQNNHSNNNYHSHHSHQNNHQNLHNQEHQTHLPNIQSHKDKSLDMLTQDKLTAHHAKCYLVTCMDFRLLDLIVKFMDSKGYNTNYDQFILAGASLGFTQQQFPYWGMALLDHMKIGRTLHHFRQIIFIDHLDCGAYKKFYPNIQNTVQEIEYHKIHMQKARDALAIKFPNFKFTGYLMDLQGNCNKIQIHQNIKFIDHKSSEKQDFLSQIPQKHKHFGHITHYHQKQ